MKFKTNTFNKGTKAAKANIVPVFDGTKSKRRTVGKFIMANIARIMPIKGKNGPWPPPPK